MSLLTIFLVLLSTVLHAGWNLLGRKCHATSAFFGRMLTVGLAVGFVPFVVSEVITRSMPPLAWLCVLGSGTCAGLYYFFLGFGYRSGDFTVVYPVARALPVLLVGVADALRGRMPTSMGWLGMLIVVVGCLLTPLHSLRDLTLRRYINRAMLWILLTALGTVGYSLLDKIGSELVLPGPGSAARYAYVFLFVSFFVYQPLHCRFGRTEDDVILIGWFWPAVAAVCTYGSYFLVLWAFQSAGRASYVVAFRQFSIVIGVVTAFALFREKGLVIRLTGTLLITAGLLVIALWGS